MRNLPTDLPDRLGRARGTIGGDPGQGSLALIQGPLQTPQKGDDIVMARIVIAPLVEHPCALPGVDRREHTVRPVVECIDRHVARKRLKRPMQECTVRVALRLFPPASTPFWMVANGTKTR